MNKLQGFFALANSHLPAVPWKKYTKQTVLDNQVLWTIRSAVLQGDDLNLPRKIGVTAFEAKQFADQLLTTLNKDDMVIYYPFFIAQKSGVIEISDKRTVIEAVNEDLWNLVTYSKKDITIVFEDDDIKFIGNDQFLDEKELFELIDYCVTIKKRFISEISFGKSIFLEWSFAYQSDIQKRAIGDKNLVFYEIRTV